MHIQRIAAKYQYSRLIRNVLINGHPGAALGTNNQVPIGITEPLQKSFHAPLYRVQSLTKLFGKHTEQKNREESL
jgi:hypothetical protein